MSAQAIDQDYDRTNPIINLVLPLFILTSTFVVLVLLKAVSYTHVRMKKTYENIKKKTFNSWFIRILEEEYITITLGCLIKIYAIDFTNAYEGVSSTFAIVLLLTTIAFPISVTIFLWKIHKEDPNIMLEQAFK